MSTTTILAISTPVVAIAGLIFTYLSASRDRRATLELTRESHDHEMEVRRRERAYEARREAYRATLRWALVTIQQVERTDPILTYEGDPEPPANVPQEFFDTLRIEVGAFGSAEVKQAILEFRDAAGAFFRRNQLTRRIRDKDVPTEEAVKVHLERDEARQKA